MVGLRLRGGCTSATGFRASSSSRTACASAVRKIPVEVGNGAADRGRRRALISVSLPDSQARSWRGTARRRNRPLAAWRRTRTVELATRSELCPADVRARGAGPDS